MFENLIEVLKANPRKIVYTEGTDARILESAARLKKEGFLTPVLVGPVEEVKAVAANGGFDIEGLEILDPETYPGMEEMVKTMVELRKGKMTEEECRTLLQKGINNGINLLGINSFWTGTVTGIVIIVSVYVGMVAGKNSKKRK